MLSFWVLKQYIFLFHDQIISFLSSLRRLEDEILGLVKYTVNINLL